MSQEMVAKKKRGFASMTPEARREIASKGGKRAHELGLAHEFTNEEAKIAGSKGGLVLSQDKDHMQKIAKRGAQKRWEIYREKQRNESE